ncbi:hypothetical protein GALMADRAFT_1301078 [Galerina marginata CBS 339.88]|uniref:DUF6534 domain-containing protein n=1 Tax=Galerina marginata (strain CBS 339.88) TaxID=685588 RepID=A0A067T6W8_GALM3|nr:hypothetical protein GALMADRAFT_1301078 [Galerina marginata CBS 339.88]
MSALPLSKLVDLPNTFGATLIGALISAMLYGLTTLQTYLYYVSYPKDSTNMKLLVAFIWVLDTVHFALISQTVYYYLVTNYFNPLGLVDGHWSLFVSVILNSIIACIVQSFFIVRIFRLCKAKVRWWVASVLGMLVVAHFAFGIETVVFMFIKKELARIPEINLFAATPFAIFAVLSDILIAGALCYLLHGSRTGFKRTDTIVTTLIIYAINRCLLTSVVAVLEVIVFSVMPHSLWFVAIDFFIGRLYANSLLATLNSRASVLATKGSTLNSVHVSSDIQFNDLSGGSNTVRALQLCHYISPHRLRI